MEVTVSGFHWTTAEAREFDILRGIGNQTALLDKKYRRCAYLMESAYALSIESVRNLSSNPGCE